MHSNQIPYEHVINFTLNDLKELIKNLGVKVIVEQMDEDTISSLNEGIRAYYIKKANERNR